MDIHSAVTPDKVMPFRRFIEEASLVAIDSNFPQETIESVLQLCQESKVPVFFEPTDPRKAIKALKSKWSNAITYTSPNIHELAAMLGQSEPISKHNLIESARKLKEQLVGLKALLVTLGHDGVLLLDHQAKHYKVEPATDIASVSGAGDCFSAGFMAGILHECDHETSVLMGLKAAQLSLRCMEAVPEDMTLVDIKI